MSGWKKARAIAAAATLLLGACMASAQVPAVSPPVTPSPGAPTAMPPVTPPAGTPAAAPKNLWSFLCLTPEQAEACKKKICASPLAQLLGGVLTPARAFSGGVLPKFCPGPNDPNKDDLKKPAESAEGAAARIKQKEAEAKARRAAVRYLGTVDCQRYPEAEKALVNALRGDENECVRLEAAQALCNGCCCSRATIEALAATVSGRKTNDPAERSERVRHFAAIALERCLACYHETAEAAATTPERPEEPPKTESTPPELPPGETPPGPEVRRLAPEPHVEEARRVLAVRKAQLLQRRAAVQPPAPAPSTPEPPTAPPPGEPPVQPVAHTAVSTEGWTLAQIAAAGPPAVAPALPPAAEPSVPPTGQRDLWTVLRNALR